MLDNPSDIVRRRFSINGSENAVEGRTRVETNFLVQLIYFNVTDLFIDQTFGGRNPVGINKRNEILSVNFIDYLRNFTNRDVRFLGKHADMQVGIKIKLINAQIFIDNGFDAISFIGGNSCLRIGIQLVGYAVKTGLQDNQILFETDEGRQDNERRGQQYIGEIFLIACPFCGQTENYGRALVNNYGYDVQ